MLLKPLSATNLHVMSFQNMFDPDRPRQNVGLELDPICLTLW